MCFWSLLRRSKDKDPPVVHKNAKFHRSVCGREREVIVDKNSFWTIKAGEKRDLDRILSEFLEAQDVRTILATNSFELWLRKKAVEMGAEFPAVNCISLAWDMPVEAKIAAGKALLAKCAVGEEGFSEADIPEAPEVQLRRDDEVNEVLVLEVNLRDKDSQPGYLRTLDAWWDLFEMPEDFKAKGYKKVRWNYLQAKEDIIRRLPEYEYKPGIRWVVVDTKAYHGKSCDQAVELSGRDSVTLAGLEGIMLLAQCPKWAESWDGKDSPFPNFAGLQVFYNGDWSRSVYVSRWDGGNREVELSGVWSGLVYSDRSCPSVRECKSS